MNNYKKKLKEKLEGSPEIKKSNAKERIEELLNAYNHILNDYACCHAYQNSCACEGITIKEDLKYHLFKIIEEEKKLNLSQAKVIIQHAKETESEQKKAILSKAKAILDAEAIYYGTDKHGLSYEQLEDIINKV